MFREQSCLSASRTTHKLALIALRAEQHAQNFKNQLFIIHTNPFFRTVASHPHSTHISYSKSVSHTSPSILVDFVVNAHEYKPLNTPK